MGMQGDERSYLGRIWSGLKTGGSSITTLVVATADAVTNTLMTHVVGNKTDAAVTTVGTTKSLMGYLKGCLTLVDGIVTRTTSVEYTTALNYLDAGGEQTLVELTGTTRKIVDSVWADTAALTQNGSFEVYVKIDGTNYRLWKSVSFTVATDGAINVLAGIGPVAFNTDFKVTYTEGGDEGADRSIPVLCVYRTVE